MVTAIEAGIEGNLERIDPANSVWVGDGDPGVVNENPLGKVPVLTTGIGLRMIDSTLIGEYFASLALAIELLPVDGAKRWQVRNLQALAQAPWTQ